MSSETKSHPVSHHDAEGWAYEWHEGQIDRDGEPHIDHVRRVARMVSVDKRIVAYLHDVIEDCNVPLDELRARGVSERDVRAINWLTRKPGDTYARYSDIAIATGEAGMVARRVKEADLIDNLTRCLRTDDEAQGRYRAALPVIQQAMVGR